MALSNRDRIQKMFEVMAPPLDDFISTVIGRGTRTGAQWVQLVEAKDAKNNIGDRTYDPLDPQVQLRMLTEKNITTGAKPGWFPFSDPLGRTGESFCSELREVRNRWAHNGAFTDDDAYRALDTGERMLRLINAPTEAEAVKRTRLDLRRVTASKDDKRTLKAAATTTTPESAGLRPWREVLRPHQDVATGNFHASEFAANLYKVAAGDEEQGEYGDPVEFFRRTYLTEGLRDLIDRAARRVSGDDNASPVINLQTNFGGGKTHSMMSLWHLAGGTPLADYPQELQELMAASGYQEPESIRRVAVVGNHFSPSGEVKQDGTRINTVWGELAWQLGGAEAYGTVAEADRTSSPPGNALHVLLERYAPAVILIDEWVAYARSLVGRDDLAGGTFDDQFTFAQALTEAVMGTSGVLLAVSIPASETGEDTVVAGSDEEVGGENGLRALKRLQNVVRRVADQWRPASSDEAYSIVRQRLFAEADSEALAAIGATARAFGEFYRKESDHFPREARDPAYEERIKRTYPVHPELFDRLYEDWSSLERFQRTRGVLRLMNTVIYALWAGEDTSPLILPGSIPLGVPSVNSELTQYLQDSWKAIIDADVDGPNAEPVKIDTEKPALGQRSLTKRLARTVFFGSVPTLGSAHKGMEAPRVFLGTAAPGDVPGNFNTALIQLGDRATYFYSGQGKYWYDLQANITRRARDQAERMPREDVWAEIVRRLDTQGRRRGNFAGVHVCPQESSDIRDTDEARLVILHPRLSHSRRDSESTAMDFARKATESKGSAHRTYRNMVVFLAADAARLAELESSVRVFLGWNSVLSTHDLDLTQNQRNQAEERRKSADAQAESRLFNAYQWVLMPRMPNPAAPFEMAETKAEGQTDALAERVSKRLSNDAELYTQQAGRLIRLELNRVPALWRSGHVRVGDLWKMYASYAYMPRLRDQSVLTNGLLDQPPLWGKDGFALAQGYDEASGRYEGLVLPSDGLDSVAVTDDLLIVQPVPAKQQRETDAAASPAPVPEGTVDDSGSVVPVEDTGTGGGGSSPSVPATASPSGSAKKTRFFGTKELSPERYGTDFKKIAEEILTHLSGSSDTGLVVRIEIEATNAQGFDESKIRTVSENAQTLKFEQSGFEES